MGRWGEGHGATADEHAVGEEVRTNERSGCCVGHQTDKDKASEASVSERDGSAPTEPRTRVQMGVTDGHPTKNYQSERRGENERLQIFIFWN
jgi:hypothetical protein